MAPAFSLPPLPALPVVEALPALLAALENGPRAVLEAPPGAGKTTVVPLALLAAPWRRPEQKILVLEPRQLAARAAAARLAQLLGEPVGQTVGYRVRLDSKVSAQTRLEVITEGVLTRLLQADPALEDVAAVVFDEFHERSLPADLGLALTLDAQAVLRPDLRLLLMSATLEAGRLGQWLPAPVVSSAGFLYPIQTHYLSPREAAGLPGKPRERLTQAVPAAVRRALAEQPSGDVLVFLPGVGDLQRIFNLLDGRLPADTDLFLLHGELPLERQNEALRPAPAGRRKVVLSTAVAETSLTIEGVTAVVDGGFSRVPRYVPRTGFTTLETVPVSRAEADQRRGRAGRLAPGTCYRLYTEAEAQSWPRHRPPEIQTAELSALALETAVWGTPAEALRWLDPPPPAALAQARTLLAELGALQLGIRNYELRIGSNDAAAQIPNSQFLIPNSHGRALAGLGLPPRLGHLVRRGAELGLGAEAAALAALLAERDLLRWADPQDPRPLPPDLRLRLDALQTGRPPLPGLALHPATLQKVRASVKGLAGKRVGGQELQKPTNPTPSPSYLLKPTSLAALAYPERVAQREAPDRLRLRSGQRVSLRTEDVDAGAEFFAVAHLSGEAAQPRAALAAPLSRAEIELLFGEQVLTVDEVRFDPAAGRVLGRRARRLGALLLDEKPLPQPDPALVAEALLCHVQATGLHLLNWTPAARQLQQRLQFLHAAAHNGRLALPSPTGLRAASGEEGQGGEPEAWPATDEATLLAELPAWLGPHLAGLRTLDQVQRLDLTEPLLARLPGGYAQRQALDRLAPPALEVPSGSTVTLDYSDPAQPVLAVKLQELFGLTETPAVAGGRVPLLLHLLSPGGRPAQVTKDLRSFWERGYFEVRKDLKGRYPKHPWPDEPMRHVPTRLTKKRLGEG